MVLDMDRVTGNDGAGGSGQSEPPREDPPARADEPDAAYRAAVRRYACLSGRRR
jgi:hypothetical protein